MTVRKEIFIAVMNALKNIQGLEKIEYFKNQKFEDYTAAFIRIKTIKWEPMVENYQEGQSGIDVIFQCRDGWTDKTNNTDDPENGFIEIDLIDKIVENLQFLSGANFKGLQLEDEEDEDEEERGIMKYRLSFSTTVYRRINYRYNNKKLNLNNN